MCWRPVFIGAILACLVGCASSSSTDGGVDAGDAGPLNRPAFSSTTSTAGDAGTAPAVLDGGSVGVEGTGNVGVDDAGSVGVLDAGTVCPIGDAGPSPSCCQPEGNSCNQGSDCCQGNCSGSPGVCCQTGACP